MFIFLLFILAQETFDEMVMQQNACSVSQSLLIVTWSKHTGPFVFVAAAVVVCIAIPCLQKIQQINKWGKKYRDLLLITKLQYSCCL